MPRDHEEDHLVAFYRQLWLVKRAIVLLLSFLLSPLICKLLLCLFTIAAAFWEAYAELEVWLRLHSVCVCVGG